MARARILSSLLALAVATTVGLTPFASGCSFKLVRPAPAPADWPNPVVPSSSQQGCTASLAPPAADTAIFGGLAGVAVLERHAGSTAITAGLALSSIPFLVSAVYGYVTTANCRRYDHLFNASE
jgi:hypothetical protein